MILTPCITLACSQVAGWQDQQARPTSTTYTFTSWVWQPCYTVLEILSARNAWQSSL